MHWQGQKRVEILMQIMLLVSAIAAFGIGYTIGYFRMMMLVYVGGVVLTVLITIPNWSFFNRHPLKWLDPSEAAFQEEGTKAQKWWAGLFLRSEFMAEMDAGV